MKETVTVIIVSYNSCKVLQQCLNHVVSVSGRWPIQIIVIDNNSSDGSAEMVQETFPDVHLVRNEENAGFAPAANQGIRLAYGDFILLLNSDAFISEESLAYLMDFMHQNPRAGLCGPQLLFPDGTWQRSFGRFPCSRVALLDALGITSLETLIARCIWKWKKGPRPAREVEYIDGACMLIRKNVVQEIGLLDEEYFFFGEDADFCHRARLAGWKTFLVIQSRVIHIRGASYRKDRLRQVSLFKRRSMERYIIEYHGEQSWKRYVRLMRCNFFLRYLICRLAALTHLLKSPSCWKYQIIGSAFSSAGRSSVEKIEDPLCERRNRPKADRAANYPR